MLHTIQAFLITLSITAFSFSSGVFISEYTEGSSYNKYIEIFNGTGADVDLSSYELWKIANGGSWSESSLSLSTKVFAGDVYIVCHASSDPIILAECDGTWTQANFNGDDAVGTDGDSPSGGWPVADDSNGTKDQILVRILLL